MIASHLRPNERVHPLKYKNIEETRLIETLRHSGVDSDRVELRLIQKLREAKYTPRRMVWWQTKGYHCHFQYAHKIYGEVEYALGQARN